jgi:glutathione synthase/RimK-type ligase-like ATP-grasp enzyme
MILVLTERFDPHADAVIDMLNRSNAPAVRFETADFPSRVTATLRFDDSSDGAVLRIGEADIHLGSVRTVWYRRPAPPQVSAELEELDREFAKGEASHMLLSVWRLLRNCFWVNPRDSSLNAECKPFQLQVAREVGFEVPRTLMTNDPALVADFVRRCAGEAIYKPFSPHVRLPPAGTDSAARTIYTNRIRVQDLERTESVRWAPCIFQEYVEKKVEIRVTVIGRKLFAAEIHSQDSERTRTDWRRYDLERTPHRPHTLPPAVAGRCMELVRRLGLVFGCIDLILTPDGRYVFLEINPNGQWYWVEQLTGLPLLENFCQMLTQGTPDYDDPVQAVDVAAG